MRKISIPWSSVYRLPFGSAAPVWIAYGLVALVFTWPLSLHMTTAIPGDGTDCRLGAWNLWWFARAVGEGRNPFHTDLLYHPYGTDLYLHTLMPMDGLLVLPVQVIWGPIAAYNAAVLLSLSLSAWGAYLLARDRLKQAAVPLGGWCRSVPALAAGLLFGFSPYMADHLLSHLNLLSAEGLPWATLALLRAGEVSARPRAASGALSLATLPLRWAVTAAGCLVFTTLCDLQYILFLAVGTGLVGLVVAARRQWSRLAGPALAWAIFLVVISPLAVGAAQQAAHTPRTTFADDIAGYSADILAYVIPSPFHPLWGQWAAERLQPIHGAIIEKVMFPTYTGLILAGVGLVLGRRRNWPVLGWVAGGAAFFVLSLGPLLHVGGSQWPVPLPDAFFYQIPGVNLTRVPGRWVVMVMLLVSVLAAFGLAGLLSPADASAGNFRSRRVCAIGGPALFLLCLELCPAPYRLTTWNVPRGLATLATLPEHLAVFHLPIRPYDASNLQAQIAHGHPILGGYVSRPPAYPLFEGVPLFTQLKLHADAPDLCAPALDGLGPGLFAYFTTGALVLHKDRLSPNRMLFNQRLAERAGLGAPAYEDAEVIIYRPGPAPPPPAWANLDINTWYEQELSPDGSKPIRWMMNMGTIEVWRPLGGIATLHLRIMGVPASRRVAVLVAGVPSSYMTLTGQTVPLVIPLPAATGRTQVTLQALDLPVTAVPGDPRQDARPRSLALVSCALDTRP